MATSYTTLLGLALPVQGELQGTWGDEVNNYITNYLDAAVAGTQTLSTDADVTLTKTTGTSLGATSSQYSILRFSGARTAQRTVTVPAASKTYVAINDTTGGFAVKVVGAGPTTGITIAAGEAAVIAWNGSDFVKISSNQVTLAGNNAFTGANTFYNNTGQTFGTATSTQDGLILTGRAGGSSSYRTSITPGTLAASNTLTLPIETTTLAGLGTAQTFSATQTFSGAVTMSATTQNIALGTSQTTGTWTAGGTDQTGTITLDQSTKAHTLNIGSGATESAATKTINIGTGGVATSTTAIAIGSTNGTTTTLNGTVNATGALTVTGAVTANGNVTLGDASADTVTVNGTSTFTAKPTVQLTSAATNTVTQAMRLDSQSSGTPAAGIGVGLEFAAETAAGNTEVGATLEAITTDVTAASEDFDLSVKLMIAGAAATEVARFKPTGLTLATGDTYQINNTDVLSATTLGSGVVTSSLTTVGTIGTGVWQGTVVGSTYGGTGINNGGRTLTINTNSGTIAFSGASTTMTFPAASATLAGLGTTQTFTGINTFTPTARTSGVASYFTLTTPADTGQTASTESIGANFTAATRTWATGALTLQRERVFAAPTYAFAGASTLTTAVNVDIAAPVAGANATITNAYALRAAASQFTGAVNITGLTASKPVFTDANKNLTSTGTVPVDQGGTGQTSYTNGELLIGNTTGNTLTKSTLTAGSGVSITNGAGSITIAATGSGGTVTSVDVSGGTTGLTTSGGPVTGSGTITLAGTLAVANGGTGQTSYTNGQLLIGNTTGNTLTKATLTAGSGISITNGTGSITIAATSSGGDVVGPASSTDNAVVRFDGATGKLVQNSAVTIADTTGDITGGAYNKVTITAPATSATLTIADGKTLTANNSLTLAGTDATTMTFPTTDASIARTDAGQTFTGTQTVLAAATQDAVALAGRAGGTSSYITTITPGTLTASNTLTLPIVTGTLATTANTSQTFSGSTTFSSTFTLSGTTTNIALGTSQTSGTWTAGGTAQTGAMTLGRSTGAQTVNIATGATATATTKAVNIGTAGLSGSTTNLTYGSAVSGSTTTHVWNSGGTEAARLDSTGLGIGTSSPGYKLTVAGTSGSATVSLLETGVRSWGIRAGGSATNTFDIADFTASASRLIIDSSGNLGLGVTPSAWETSLSRALQLNGGSLWGYSTSQINVLQNAYYNASGNFVYTNTAAASAYRQISGAHSWLTAASGTAGNTITFSQAMTLDTSGNLGIGTSSPASFNAAGLPLVVGSGSGNTGMTIYSGTASNGSIHFADGTTTTDSYRGIVTYSHTNNSMAFYTDATLRATIDSSGNLGIGTSSPPAFANYTSLRVGGSSTTRGLISAYDGTTDMRLSTANNSVGYVGTASNNPVAIQTNGAEVARFDTSGNLGLGVTPSAWGTGFRALDVRTTGVYDVLGSESGLTFNAYYDTAWKYKGSGGTATALRYVQANGQHQWYTAPSGTAGNAITFTQAMTLDSSGNLGVGTTSPLFKLVISNGGAAGLELDPTAVASGALVQAYNRSGAAYTQLTYDGLLHVFRTSGTERARITSGGNVGIGTTSPQKPLHVYSSTAAVGNATMIVEGATGGYGAGVSFQSVLTGGSLAEMARITADGEAAWNTTGSTQDAGLRFYTALDGTVAEKIRLDASGNFGVGSTSPSTYGKFVVEGTGAFTSAMVSTSSTLSHKPTLEFRKTVATGSGSTNNVGRISFNAKWDSVQQEIGYLSADMTNVSNVLSTTKLRLAGVSYPAVAEDYIEIDQGTATTVESSGNIVLDAAKDMTLQTGGSSYVIKFTLDAAERARITAAGNIKIGGTASRATTEGTNQLVLFNGTAPAGTLTNGVSFYSASGEARVMDAAGNSTLLSPHDQATNEWIFHSKHTPTGKVLRIDVERLLKFVNDHFGLDMVQEFIEK